MGMVFAPSANAVLDSVRPQEVGQASGATNAIRELGGVMGIAVLATVFSSAGWLRVAAGLRRRHDGGAAGRSRSPGARRARSAAGARRAQGAPRAASGWTWRRGTRRRLNRSAADHEPEGRYPPARERFRVQEPRRHPCGARPAQRGLPRSRQRDPAEPRRPRADGLGRALGPAGDRRRARPDEARADPVRRLGLRHRGPGRRRRSHAKQPVETAGGRSPSGPARTTCPGTTTTGIRTACRSRGRRPARPRLTPPPAPLRTPGEQLHLTRGRPARHRRVPVGRRAAA